MSRILVLLELRGGNDGLNTVVPFADRRYRELRPGIAVPRERVLPLDEKVGLHEKLEPLMESWKARDLAIVQGVGYPNPNRSHFRSIEIWDTASEASQTLNDGWIARTFEKVARPQGAGVDCVVADTNVLPSAGTALRTIVMSSADKFLEQADKNRATAMGKSPNMALKYILSVRNEVNAAASGLRDLLRDAPEPKTPYGNIGVLGPQLDLATRLLVAKVPLVAIKVAMTGFDTHTAQAGLHERLLNQLAIGLATFRSNLIAANVWGGVAVMTYSEFGRRAQENANGGTDHGTAAPLFVLGGGIKGGLHGAQPSLSDLQDGDLKHAVDFRSVYGAVAQGCWGLARDYGLRQGRPLGLF
jgi:uncharacterized protein (DUF1501 family)